MGNIYYLVSVKHTRRDQKYIAFWRPDNCGYAWPLSWAGKYTEEQIKAKPDYYHNGDCTFAVPCELIDSLAVPPEKGYIDNDAGPVVLNKKSYWLTILEFAMEGMLHKPWPQYKGARKGPWS